MLKLFKFDFIKKYKKKINSKSTFCIKKKERINLIIIIIIDISKNKNRYVFIKYRIKNDNFVIYTCNTYIYSLLL